MMCIAIIIIKVGIADWKNLAMIIFVNVVFYTAKPGYVEEED